MTTMMNMTNMTNMTNMQNMPNMPNMPNDNYDKQIIITENKPPTYYIYIPDISGYICTSGLRDTPMACSG